MQGLDDKGLLALKSLVNLRELSVAKDSRISGLGLTALRDLKQLQVMILSTYRMLRS